MPGARHRAGGAPEREERERWEQECDGRDRGVVRPVPALHRVVLGGHRRALRLRLRRWLRRRLDVGVSRAHALA